uniref:Uncharacterized protein n=1 Tax=Arion vulgaris TaxID=1028688 RepID=A0A0B7AYW9_9EUPU
MKIQDMTLTPDRQGYLGDLMSKSFPELKELLDRQEKILLNRKFVERLPDKGERTKTFAVHLKQLIELKSRGLSSSTAYTDLMKGVPKLYKKSQTEENVNDQDIRDKDMLDSDIARDDLNVNILPEIKNNNTVSKITQAAMLDSSASLVTSLEKMSIDSSNSQKHQTDKEPYINSYERVIKKAEATFSNSKPKFFAHRTLHDNHIPPSPYVHNTRPIKSERIEESAVNLPNYKFPNSKLISIEESVKILVQQKVLNEELITQRAARKLADQLSPKMDIYLPADTDMRYREHTRADQDSDDDDDVSQDEEY